MLKLDRVQDLETLRQAALILERENEKLVEKNLELQRRLLEAQGADPNELQLKLEELQRQLSVKNKLLFGVSTRSPSNDGYFFGSFGPRPRRALQTEMTVTSCSSAE